MNRQSFLAIPLLAFVQFAGSSLALSQVIVTQPGDTAAKPSLPLSGAPRDPALQPTQSAVKPFSDDSVVTKYVLGPGDQVTLQVANLDDFGGKTFGIDGGGELSLPLLGRIKAAGLTVAVLEQEIRSRLGSILKNPDVAINMSSSGSQPVAILGAVSAPGMRQLEGHKTLFEVLSLVGGLRVDAGYQIRITRNMKFGAIPLPNARPDPTGQFTTASVKVKNVINEQISADNILIFPGDEISVPVASEVYILGSVSKPCGVLLTEHESIPTLQLLSTAEGFQRAAAPEKARILRIVPGSDQRVEVAVNLKQIFAGKEPDVQLLSNDILYVPSSRAKSAGYKVLDIVSSPSTAVSVAARY
jgi:polysaccharide biosynthesis/export protein